MEVGVEMFGVRDGFVADEGLSKERWVREIYTAEVKMGGDLLVWI